MTRRALACILAALTAAGCHAKRKPGPSALESQYCDAGVVRGVGQGSCFSVHGDTGYWNPGNGAHQGLYPATFFAVKPEREGRYALHRTSLADGSSSRTTDTEVAGWVEITEESRITLTLGSSHVSLHSDPPGPFQ